MITRVTRCLIVLLSVTTACIAAVTPPAAAQDLAPEWSYTMPGSDRDGYTDAIMGLFTEPGHSLLYVWTFEGDLYAFSRSGSVVWKGFLEDNTSMPVLNPAGDLWMVGTEKTRAYSLKGELLVDRDNVENPPQKQIKRAAITTMSPEYDAVYGLNIDGDHVWSVYGLGDFMHTVKMNINPGMYFLVETMTGDSQVFYALDPWSEVKWTYDTSDLAQMPVVGVTARVRRDGSVVFAEAFGADMFFEGYGEPGNLVSVSVGGDFEWLYPEPVFLVADTSSSDGSIIVGTDYYSVREIDRNGEDVWDLEYDGTDGLLHAHPVSEGGAVLHFWALVPETTDFFADYVARVDPAGEILFEGWVEDPEQYYGWSVLFGGFLILQDGENRIAAFSF